MKNYFNVDITQGHHTAVTGPWSELEMQALGRKDVIVADDLWHAKEMVICKECEEARIRYEGKGKERG